MQKESNPYQVIKHRHITEKSTVLQELKNAKSNRSLKNFELPKYVFIVDRDANKRMIAEAIESIYAHLKVRVLKVNTINMKQKKRRVRGRIGFKPGFKKAVVTLEKGDELDNI